MFVVTGINNIEKDGIYNASKMDKNASLLFISSDAKKTYSTRMKLGRFFTYSCFCERSFMTL